MMRAVRATLGEGNREWRMTRTLIANSRFSVSRFPPSLPHMRRFDFPCHAHHACEVISERSAYSARPASPLPFHNDVENQNRVWVFGSS